MLDHIEYSDAIANGTQKSISIGTKDNIAVCVNLTTDSLQTVLEGHGSAGSSEKMKDVVQLVMKRMAPKKAGELRTESH